MRKVLTIEHLTKEYKQGNTKIIANNDINLSIFEGEMVAIVGSSGSGKTTLLNMIGGVDKPSGGKIYINETDILNLNTKDLSEFRINNIGYIFQNYNLVNELTVVQNIRILFDITGRKYNYDFENVLFNVLGIKDFLSRYPYELSGGQQQRIAIARAMITKPQLILADEPTGNLDKKRTIEILECMKEINQSHKQTYVIVTHDELVASYCNRVIKIEDGRIL